MKQKGIYPYDYIGSFEKFNETQLPLKMTFTAFLIMKTNRPSI